VGIGHEAEKERTSGGEYLTNVKPPLAVLYKGGSMRHPLKTETICYHKSEVEELSVYGEFLLALITDYEGNQVGLFKINGCYVAR